MPNPNQVLYRAEAHPHTLTLCESTLRNRGRFIRGAFITCFGGESREGAFDNLGRLLGRPSAISSSSKHFENLRLGGGMCISAILAFRISRIKLSISAVVVGRSPTPKAAISFVSSVIVFSVTEPKPMFCSPLSISPKSSAKVNLSESFFKSSYNRVLRGRAGMEGELGGGMQVRYIFRLVFQSELSSHDSSLYCLVVCLDQGKFLIYGKGMFRLLLLFLVALDAIFGGL